MNRERVSDGDLWQLSATGDSDAFGSLFERHVDAVYNHCFRRTGSWHEADDLTSLVFLEAWRRRSDVALAGESILPWLLAVANNTLRNQSRSRRRYARLIAKLPAAELAADHADDAADRVDDERTMSRIHEVFRQLAPQEQDVLALVIWAGLAYAEAAVALDVPVGTVRSRLARARQHLRELTDHLGMGFEPGEVVIAASRISTLTERQARR